MPGITSLAGFVAAALVVLLTPGPGVLYVVTRSLSQGQAAGFVSALGLSAGALVHVAAVTAGLSALLLASAAAFGVVKALGAAYLIYLGVRTLMSRSAGAHAEAAGPRPLRRIFTDGIVVSIFNPKIAVFFLAFLPQFVSPDRGPVQQQLLFLGLLYCGLALITDGTYAVIAGRLGGLLRGSALGGPLPRYASGAVYIGLGVSTAFAERK